jgi:hypothetical protein
VTGKVSESSTRACRPRLAPLGYDQPRPIWLTQRPAWVGVGGVQATKPHSSETRRDHLLRPSRSLRFAHCPATLAGPASPALTSPRSGTSADPSSAASSTTISEPHRSPGQGQWPSSGTPQGPACSPNIRPFRGTFFRQGRDAFRSPPGLVSAVVGDGGVVRARGGPAATTGDEHPASRADRH